MTSFIPSFMLYTHPVVDVATIFADPFALPKLGFFGIAGGRLFLVSKDVQGGGRRSADLRCRAHRCHKNRRKGSGSAEAESGKQERQKRQEAVVHCCLGLGCSLCIVGR
jgi:hypothetical protein